MTLAGPFDYFVVFANMRTGSNYLEENLNDYDRLHCWGEAFNPHFIGHAGKTEMAGVSLAEREAQPERLLTAIRSKTDGLAGFRFFPGHDPRIFDVALKNPRCAKIILPRNPIESYVSQKIAAATGQWRLGDMKTAKTAKARFDKQEFEGFLADLQAFQLDLLTGLQTTGQTAFYVGYDDLHNLDVLNGLAKFLGCDSPKDKANTRTKVQNPQVLRDKVENYEEMTAALSGFDHFNLSRTPNFEPRRGPNVPRYVASEVAPLLYMPIKASAEAEVLQWLSSLGETRSGFTQKTLRQWKRKNTGHRSFTIVCHPVARLHRAFCDHILATDGDVYLEIRQRLIKDYSIGIPEVLSPDYSRDAHRAAFIAFAEWIKGNLNGQTSVRVDASWATQAETIAGFSQFGSPDMVIRADDMKRDLPLLGQWVGAKTEPVPGLAADTPFALSDIYDEHVEAAVKAAYQKDYMMFGFGPWAR